MKSRVFDLEALGQADQPLVVIAGATATGKSALALELAQKAPAVIINADSMQVYDALPILTAQPSEAERRLCPHRLYGTIPLDQTCSAAHWAHLAKNELVAAWDEGVLPIVVGGTGLYIRTLLEGISPIPDIQPDVRSKVRALASAEGGLGLKKALAPLDAILAERLELGDTQRLSRALEVVWSTGTPLSEWQKRPPEGGILAQEGLTLSKAVVERERTALYERCNTRLLTMLEGAALEELRGLLAMDVAEDHPLLRAVAVPPLRAYLAGDLTYERALELAQRDTRRFAKRQLTWLRQQFGDWPRYAME
ncbi:MAG: tRNA (adenosine(37)-N6)-dimethylallyltransferase MiaA [Pseudomonadota bacterium]